MEKRIFQSGDLIRIFESKTGKLMKQYGFTKDKGWIVLEWGIVMYAIYKQNKFEAEYENKHEVILYSRVKFKKFGMYHIKKNQPTTR